MSTSPARSLLVLGVGAALGAAAVGIFPGGFFNDCAAATQPDEAPAARGGAGSPGAEAPAVADAATEPSPAVRRRARTTTSRGPLTPTTYDPSVSLAPLVEELGPAVVHIRVAQTVDQSDIPRQLRPFVNPDQLDEFRMRQGEGTGFFISADGYLLTNDHVVSGADELTVTLLDDRAYPARVIGTDPNTDIALVKVDAEGDLPWVHLGSSGDARVGDRVVAIGNPFGLSHTVTEGILSAKGRVIGAGPYDDFLQTDASINPGNSGGPLFNLSGEVIGINTAINPRGQGIGFSVPIDQVRPLIDDLKKDGKVSRGWLGVGLQAIDPVLAKHLGRDDIEGTVVGQVYPGTPAADAGLEVGDIIVRLDGEPVASSEVLVRRVGTLAPGEKVRLEVLRAGETVQLTARLGERPDRDDLERGRIPSESRPRR